MDAKAIRSFAVCDEDIGIADGKHRRGVFAAQQFDAYCAGLERTHHALMQAQKSERIGMTALGDHERFGDVVAVVHVHSAAASLAKPAAGTSTQSGRLFAS